MSIYLAPGMKLSRALQKMRQKAIDRLNDQSGRPMYHTDADRLASWYITCHDELLRALETIDDLKRWRPTPTAVTTEGVIGWRTCLRCQKVFRMADRGRNPFRCEDCRQLP